MLLDIQERHTLSIPNNVDSAPALGSPLFQGLVFIAVILRR